MPRLMYGTAWKEERTAEAVTAALQAGFRAIDTANQRKHYHEAGVGEAVAPFLAEHGRSSCRASSPTCADRITACPMIRARARRSRSTRALSPRWSTWASGTLTASYCTALRSARA